MVAHTVTSTQSLGYFGLHYAGKPCQRRLISIATITSAFLLRRIGSSRCVSRREPRARARTLQDAAPDAARERAVRDPPAPPGPPGLTLPTLPAALADSAPKAGDVASLVNVTLVEGTDYASYQDFRQNADQNLLIASPSWSSNGRLQVSRNR